MKLLRIQVKTDGLDGACPIYYESPFPVATDQEIASHVLRASKRRLCRMLRDPGVFFFGVACANLVPKGALL